ncbi:chloride channel protein [Phyllobacterium sp. P30BS-XVII]|uniref:chloride channel protein n=1 Tax=Phyllobacterium sp. P30BS-XVII TaxID=2587046 RepID=UPI000DDD03FC|nr:chloride channel protein [Phyllobacterium sp. P30BS-XVII]
MPNIAHGAQSAPVPGDFSTDRRVFILILMALIVGTGSVGAAWLLIRLIALVTNLLWFHRISIEDTSLALIQPSIMTLIIPVVGGLIIGLMARFGSEKIRGHGIPEAIEAILIGGSRLHLKVAILKPLSSAISIGSGGPFGAEGPIIMTGGAIGSLIAQCFRFSAAERKTLLVAGAAAGMTAIFGTPVAAVLLAVELLLFEWKPRSLIPVIVACVIAIAWRPLLFGHGPLFPLPSSLDLSPALLVACVGVGVSVGLVSGVLTGLLYKVEDIFARLPIHWMWWPALGGLAIGLGGMIEPRAMGVGYDVIRSLLANDMDANSVWLLVAVKAIIWIIALASGTSGGVLAPLLIMGGAVGSLEGHYLPGAGGCWALLGMAAMMGGTMRSPLTGILFAVELTGNIEMLVPLLIATASAYTVTVLLLKRSILTEKIARRGQHIIREYSVDPFELLRVSEVMVSPADTLPASLSVDEAVNFFQSDDHRHKSYPLADANGALVGIVSRADVLKWTSEGKHVDQTLFELQSDSAILVGYPDEIVARLADKMVLNDVGRVPVIERGSRKILGLVSRKDLLQIRRTTHSAEQDRSAFVGNGKKPARVRHDAA